MRGPNIGVGVSVSVAIRISEEVIPRFFPPPLVRFVVHPQCIGVSLMCHMLYSVIRMGLIGLHRSVRDGLCSLRVGELLICL